MCVISRNLRALFTATRDHTRARMNHVPRMTAPGLAPAGAGTHDKRTIRPWATQRQPTGYLAVVAAAAALSSAHAQQFPSHERAGAGRVAAEGHKPSVSLLKEGLSAEAAIATLRILWHCVIISPSAAWPHSRCNQSSTRARKFDAPVTAS